MASEVFNHIASLTRQGKVTEAIALCEAELGDPKDPAAEPHIALLLCMCLGATGRPGEAAAVYEKYQDALLRAGGDLAASAAVAARHVPGIERWFRAKAPSYGGGPIGFSQRSTTGAWCEQHGVPRVVIDAAQDVVLPDGAAYTTDPFVVHTIPSGEILCGWDFVFTPTGHLLSDSGYMPLNTYFGVFPYAIAEPLNLVAHLWPETVEEVEHDALFLSAPRAFHVGHFIVDFLPRLRALSENVKVAFPREARTKLVDLLAHFGISGDRIIWCDLGKRYRFRNLIVAQVGAHHKPNPKNVGFVRAALAPKHPAPPHMSGVYFDRAVGTRQVANQAEVDEVLAEFKIRRISLESLTIAQQRRALAEARVLVGIYGSDLLACLFAPQGASAVELIWQDQDDSTIGPWCMLNGLHLDRLVCDTAPDAAQRKLKKDRDLIVDCGALRARLMRIA